MDPLVTALSHVWANLRAEHQLFWTYHWRSKGRDYYGDHLLYQRLYEARVLEIDRMAEVLMALGGPAAVDPMRSWAMVNQTITAAEARQGADVQKAIALVADTLNKIEVADAQARQSRFPLAVNNVLAGIADKHLEALYLLRQRAM